MNSVHYDARGVKSFAYTAALSARFAPAKRYTIAGVTHPDGRPKILLMGDPRTRFAEPVQRRGGY